MQYPEYTPCDRLKYEVSARTSPTKIWYMAVLPLERESSIVRCGARMSSSGGFVDYC